MRFFLDTEFLEAGPKRPLQLVSIGLVAEDGREYYAACTDFDESSADAWVRENVLPHLPPRGAANWKSRPQIAGDLLTFVGDDPPTWWVDYGAYDHVVVAQIFGQLTDLPRGWPMFSHDLQQVRSVLGNPPLSANGDSTHDALEDARRLRDEWIYLRKTAVTWAVANGFQEPERLAAALLGPPLSST